MAAFHVVGVYFQLGLCVEFGSLGQQQGLAELMAIGPLRVLPDENFPLKDAARIVVESALIYFPRGAFRLRVIDKSRRVDVLTVTSRVGTVQLAFDPPAIERGVNLVPRQSTTDMQGVVFIAPAIRNGNCRRRNMVCVHRFVLELSVPQHRIGAECDLRDAIAQIRPIEADMALINCCRCPVAKDNQMTWVKSDGVGIAHSDRDNMHRTLHIDPVCHLDRQPIAQKRRIESQHRHVVTGRPATQQCLKPCRLRLDRFAETRNAEPFRQCVDIGKIRPKAAVHQNQPRRVYGKRARRHPIKRGRARQNRGGELHAAHPRQIGVFPSLDTRPRQAERPVSGQAIAAQPVQPLQTGAGQHRRSSVVMFRQGQIHRHSIGHFCCNSLRLLSRRTGSTLLFPAPEPDLSDRI